MKSLRISAELHDVLTLKNDNRFTMAQLTQAYLNHPRCSHTKPSAARQFVYRHLLRLVASGHVARYGEGRRANYQLIKRLEPCDATDSSTDMESEPETPEAPNHPPVRGAGDTLKARLSQHRSDMLCAMGEAEEYSALCDDHPELRERAQPLYNEARERSAILLGKMKALESLLDTERGRA